MEDEKTGNRESETQWGVARDYWKVRKKGGRMEDEKTGKKARNAVGSGSRLGEGKEEGRKDGRRENGKTAKAVGSGS